MKKILVKRKSPLYIYIYIYIYIYMNPDEDRNKSKLVDCQNTSIHQQFGVALGVSTTLEYIYILIYIDIY